MKKKVEFYYDLSSPYSYLASTQIEEICEKHDAELEWKPFLLGGIYKETGNRAPLEVPSKKAYLIKDVADWAKYYGVELNFPDLFPLNSVKPMRGALAAKEKGKVRDYTHKLFRLYWVQGKDLNQDEVLKDALNELGIDTDWFFRRIGEQDIKDRLREETNEAARQGAFGAPTIFIGDKMFWGNDRLMFVEEHLKSL
ncbi:MAG TPA: 2-hydroxychromene-2-carboxylate isomerase [Thermodesulfobacteriota bacterium]|nr:2-hydroxychromene-2-carboxylate isomerase [Thermodesulfobacteriota bacterium]